MMTRDSFDLKNAISGHVTAHFVGVNKMIPVVDHANVVTYSGADTLARLIAGQAGAAPAAIGVLYGTEAMPALDHPSSTRDHTWEAVAEQAVAIDAYDAGKNVAILPFSLMPSISAAGDDYASNVATFSGNTGAVSSYGFAGTGFADQLGLISGDVYFYQVLLLCGAPGAYTIFARSTLLKGGVYKLRPEGYELAIQWAITIK
jgi:hypothetical protein